MICGCATLKESLNMVPRAKHAEAADDEALPAVDAAELAADPPVGEAMPVVVEDWNPTENQKRNELKQERTWWERFNPLFDAGGNCFGNYFFSVLFLFFFESAVLSVFPAICMILALKAAISNSIATFWSSNFSSPTHLPWYLQHFGFGFT